MKRLLFFISWPQNNLPPTTKFKHCLSSLILFILMFSNTYAAYAGPEITGKITDVQGSPMPMVNVLVKGTSIGVLSNNDGVFTITLPDGNANPILLFSFIGYQEKEEIVGNRTTINVSMKEETGVLSESVVIGYGTVKRENLTGSVSVIKYDKELENRPITNASQALSGMAPGVWVSQNSGSPGSDEATIRVRGYGTLNNANPLILIDGVEGRMSEVNPNDIESMTVLKDAASSAIYGSRAANGVILIQTKKGRKGEDKITLTYNGYAAIQQLGRRYDIISNSAEYMEMWNKARDGDPLFPADVIEGFRTGTDPYRYPNTNYFDEVFRVAPLHQHNISISSNTKKSDTYLSLNYMNQEGIIRNTSSDRLSLTLNNSLQVTKWLKAGARIRLMKKKDDQPFDGISRIIYMMANGHPFTTPYLRDGTTFGGTQALYVSGPKEGQPIVDTRNPFPDIYNGNDRNTTNFYKANIFATIEFAEGFTLTGQYSGQYNNILRDRYNQMHYTYTDIGVNKSKPLDYPTTLKIFRGVTDQYYSTLFSNLNYNKTFADMHEISLMAGVQTEDYVQKKVSAEKSDPPKDNLHQVDAGTSNPIATGERTQWRMLSYFGRINYALNAKYLAEVNLRADASSRFAKGNRWGYFPSVSAAWRAGEENFLKEANLFSNLKFRASWGKLGNQNIDDNWPYLTTLTQNYETSYNFGGQLTPGAAITKLVDPNITWETTTSAGIGVDMAFLSHRLAIEADYFSKVTKDIIVKLPIPLMMGNVAAPYENVGEMKNKGIELNISWRDNISSLGIKYAFGANVTYINNEVTKFQGDQSPDQLYLIREGFSYKTLYGFIFDGIYQSNEEGATHMHSNGYKPKQGDIRYVDRNNDGILDYRDKAEIGNTIPKITYAFNGNISWKGFDLNFIFQGIGKANGYFQNAWTEPLGISGGTITERWRGAWTEENKSNTLPRIAVNDTWNRQESSFWATDISWFKLKNIQLGYSFPKALVDKLSINQLYLYVNATNVFTIVSSNYEGFDPERDTFGSGYNQYPTPKIYSVGLNLTF